MNARNATKQAAPGTRASAARDELSTVSTEALLKQRGRIARKLRDVQIQHRATPFSADEVEALQAALRDERDAQERALDVAVEKLARQLGLEP